MPEVSEATEIGTSPSAAPPRSKRHRFRLVKVAVAFALAVGAIIYSDRQLRARQNLINSLLAREVTVMLPFVEYLNEKVTKKTTWNTLHDRVRDEKQAGKKKEFTAASYELAKFISSEISPDDERRKTVLLDVVNTAGDAPESKDAYWALFNAEWSGELRPSYRKYTDAIVRLSNTGDRTQAVELDQLAKTLHELKEDALEFETLKKLRSVAKVDRVTVDSMKRLLARLDSNDPTRVSLQEEVAAFERRQEQLAVTAKWYGTFEAARPKANLADLEKLRAGAPSKELDPFLASADVRMIQAYINAGRYGEVVRLRENLAKSDFDSQDMDEANSLSMQLSEEINPPKPNTKKGPAAIPPPDYTGIQWNRWRGLLDAHRIPDADAIAAELFDAKDKVLATAIAEEKLLSEGTLDKLSPVMTMTIQSSGIPPELEGDGEVWFAGFQLKPVGKTPPANIQSSAKLWLGASKAVIVLTANEPRPSLPAPTAKSRDHDVYKDDCFELFFNPDRGFDFYYQVSVNSAGVVYDARVNNPNGFARRQFRPDKAFNLDVKSTAAKTSDGWTVRLVVPRAQILPAEANAVKFNVRRFRYVPEKDKNILHLYTWSPKVTASEHRPEQFGWLILPK